MDIQHINKAIRQAKNTNQNHQAFLEHDTKEDPFELFTDWFAKALNEEDRAFIMALATVDEGGQTEVRSVSLQELQKDKLIFYSTYHGRKAKQIEKNNKVGVHFYWPKLGRQIRIKGKIERLNKLKSSEYFSTRDREIQLAVYAWTQSTALASRDELENKIKTADKLFEDKEVPCPDHWGGYAVVPTEYEFYQRRKWLMNDIFLYTLQNNAWIKNRIAP